MENSDLVPMSHTVSHIRNTCITHKTNGKETILKKNTFSTLEIAVISVEEKLRFTQAVLYDAPEQFFCFMMAFKC